MTLHTPEFTSLIEAHIVEMESDYAYEENAVRTKKEEARRLRSLAANLDTECEVHVDNMHHITTQIAELREALK